jgi:hypothetical protein
MRRLGPNPDTLLCAAYGERKPLPFANAPLHFLTKSIRRRVFPAYVPLVIAESMCGNDVFTGCFSASAMAGKMLPRALQLLHRKRPAVPPCRIVIYGLSGRSGKSSSIRLLGQTGNFSRVSLSQACGSSPFSLAVPSRL